jgi:hypothetical protein
LRRQLHQLLSQGKVVQGHGPHAPARANPGNLVGPIVNLINQFWT